jgi:hypothetical protein
MVQREGGEVATGAKRPKRKCVRSDAEDGQLLIPKLRNFLKDAVDLTLDN